MTLEKRQELLVNLMMAFSTVSLGLDPADTDSCKLNAEKILSRATKFTEILSSKLTEEDKALSESVKGKYLA